MATGGRGPAPKDPSKRARNNASPVPQVVLRFELAEQPPLPKGVRWPGRTREWWDMWRGAAQADLFSVTDWDFLLDTALVHAAVWSGELDRMAELRLRVAKFGATPEDRARLRMVFAEADDADAKRVTPVSATERYADLHVLPAGKSTA